MKLLLLSSSTSTLRERQEERRSQGYEGSFDLLNWVVASDDIDQLILHLTFLEGKLVEVEDRYKSEFDFAERLLAKYDSK